ncbi:MAG TPA: acyl-CoA desaturase [Tepidisphaeraceae bacterium]|nr:acyl-CoA desaturase [Tepidisphaeraceae bacterium]
MTGSPATQDISPAAVADAASTPQRVKFSSSDAFLQEIKKRVDAYFHQTGRKPRDCPQMYFKTATIIAWFVSAYVLLVFFAQSWITVVPLAIILGLAMAAIGFNIQHDGGHRAYSDRRWVNKIMAMSLDLMGGSSYMWDWKHNSIHHTYPNISGQDDDIDVGILGRLSPHQKRYWFHRLQGVYLWFLYGFLAIKWHFYDDFYNVIAGKIGEHVVPRPKGWDLVVFVGGKLIFLTWAFFIPLAFHPFWPVVAVYVLAAFVSGVVLSAVFQLAHCVEEADFPMPDANGKMSTDWAIHQLQTTVDFSRRNPVLSWFLGGLNFQVEHHLFHRICHVHYPALSKVVENACKEFGVRYAANKTLFSALASHFRWLNRMGQPE